MPRRRQRPSSRVPLSLHTPVAPGSSASPSAATASPALRRACPTACALLALRLGFSAASTSPGLRHVCSGCLRLAHAQRKGSLGRAHAPGRRSRRKPVFSTPALSWASSQHVFRGFFQGAERWRPVWLATRWSGSRSGSGSATKRPKKYYCVLLSLLLAERVEERFFIFSGTLLINNLLVGHCKKITNHAGSYTLWLPLDRTIWVE
jgi:hypothetical protein